MRSSRQRQNDGVVVAALTAPLLLVGALAFASPPASDAGVAVANDAAKLERAIDAGTTPSPVPSPLVAKGEALYRAQGCEACHSTDGTRRAGPSFRKLYGSAIPLANGATVTADEAYLRDSLLYPGKHVVQGYLPIMPTYKGRLSDEDIAALIAWMRSLAN